MVTMEMLKSIIHRIFIPLLMSTITYTAEPVLSSIIVSKVISTLATGSQLIAIHAVNEFKISLQILEFNRNTYLVYS